MTTTSSPTVPDAWRRELKTRAERYAAGKALRNQVPIPATQHGCQTSSDLIRSAC